MLTWAISGVHKNRWEQLPLVCALAVVFYSTEPLAVFNNHFDAIENNSGVIFSVFSKLIVSYTELDTEKIKEAHTIFVETCIRHLSSRAGDRGVNAMLVALKQVPTILM